MDYWVETYTGKKFYPLNPRAEDICIEDIAHSLSMMCRFNGHCKEFYSVAEHSIRVAEICTDSLKLAGLLHDSAESYLSDLPKPIKDLLGNYEDLERKVLSAIYAKFGMWDCVGSRVVKIADWTLLATEARDLMKGQLKDYPIPELPLPNHIVPFSQEQAKRVFLEDFNRYKL